jgi:hypothetical protein
LLQIIGEGKILSEKSDLYGKAKGEMRLSEKILAEIPGFRGYKEKELRRESDRLVRDNIYQRLSGARSDLKEVFQILSDQKVQEVLVMMDRLIMVFDRVVEKVNHASYGYAGFFNVVKIDEEKLDRMLAFDSGLLDNANTVTEEAKAFKKEVAEGKFEGVMEQIKKLNESLSSLEDTFDTRKETILEG